MSNVLLLLGALSWNIVSSISPSQPSDRPRLIILTDISSLTAGVAEPDDGQSLIRLMLYSNEFDIEGLIATSNLGHQQTTRPDLVRQVVDAYAKVQPNLLLHDQRYPPASSLRARIKSGQPLLPAGKHPSNNASAPERTPKPRTGSFTSSMSPILAPSGSSSGVAPLTSPRPSGKSAKPGRPVISHTFSLVFGSTRSTIKTQPALGSDNNSHRSTP